MKIYRAVLEYNNNDTDEWEDWFLKTSKWYNSEELAKMHLPMLEKFAAFIKDRHANSYHFKCGEPYIEVQEVADKYSPIKLSYEENKRFSDFEFIQYSGPKTITSRVLRDSFPWGDPMIWANIGNEQFFIPLEGSIRRESGETDFYKYKPSVQKEMLALCEDYRKSIKPIYDEYRKEYKKGDNWDELPFDSPERSIGWAKQRTLGVNLLIKLLENDYMLKLTDDCILSLEDELSEDRAPEYPQYREALQKLLSMK